MTSRLLIATALGSLALTLAACGASKPQAAPSVADSLAGSPAATSPSAASPPGPNSASQGTPTSAATSKAAPTPTSSKPASHTPTKAAPTKPATTAHPSTTTTSAAGTTPQPSGAWPNASNAGYENAPGYPGQLTTYTGGDLQSNHVYKYMYFPAELFVGTVDVKYQNITFLGCLFESNKIDDTSVADYSENTVFDYDTFAPLPAKAAAPPVARDNGYQYGIDQRGDVQITVDHSEFWGFAEGIQIGFSSQAKPFSVKNSWFHDARLDGGTDHTDAILSSDGGPAFMTIDHNTISSAANTNGVAFQTAGTYYTDVAVTNNYFSGFGYTVNIGGDGKGNQRITFTGNTFGTDIKPMWGPLYGWGGTNVVWRNNKWHVAPGGYDKQASDDGKFWLPDGSLSTHDYSG